jgi:hypothetical protein
VFLFDSRRHLPLLPYVWAERRGDPGEQAASPYMGMSRVHCDVILTAYHSSAAYTTSYGLMINIKHDYTKIASTALTLKKVKNFSKQVLSYRTCTVRIFQMAVLYVYYALHRTRTRTYLSHLSYSTTAFDSFHFGTSFHD